MKISYRFFQIIQIIIKIAYTIFPILTAFYISPFQWPFILFLSLAAIAYLTDYILSSIKILFYKLRELYGCIQGIFISLQFLKKDKVRITLYKKNKNNLNQIIPYFPKYSDDSSYSYYGSFKRGLKIDKGIVGKCCSSKEPTLFVLKRKKDFKKELMEQFNFSEEEVFNLRKDRMSYLAIPVIDNRNVLYGIIYLDSSKVNTFTKEKAILLLKFSRFFIKFLQGRS